MKSAAHPHISFPVLTCLFTLKNEGEKSPVLTVSLTELSATGGGTQGA